MQFSKQDNADYIISISEKTEFLTMLVKLAQIGIVKEKEGENFHRLSASLLNYVIQTKDSELAVLLLKTLVFMQSHANCYLSNNRDNMEKLCDVISIQFFNDKEKIYLQTLKLLNFTEGKLSEDNIQNVVNRRMWEMEGNLYECFHLDLTLELLHSYLVIDHTELKGLFKDIMVDWNEINGTLSEEAFEKLLWYRFALNEEVLLVTVVDEYQERIMSDRWGIKFYRYITSKLLKNSSIDEEKMNKAITKFNKLEYLSKREKDFFTSRIKSKLMNRTKRITPKTVVDKAEKEPVSVKTITNSSEQVNTIIRLSPKNLPKNLPLQKINQKAQVYLAIYENNEMKKMTKKILIDVLFYKGREETYVTKPTLKKIRAEAGSDYFHLIDNKNTPKNKPFKKPKARNSTMLAQPTTGVSEIVNDTPKDINGFNEKSALMRMGYQITGSTKEQRWIVLKRAVPALGLKKVTYTITNNIRLRKGQKNGRNKFSYAISQWEHDLHKLKQTYYKKDFPWPKF